MGLNKDRPTDVTRFIISPFTAQHVSNVSTSIFRSLRLIVDLFHSLIKPINNPNVLLPYEQYYIQSLHREGKFITFETCWAVNSGIISEWHQVGLSLFNYQDDARSKRQWNIKNKNFLICRSWFSRLHWYVDYLWIFLDGLASLFFTLLGYPAV